MDRAASRISSNSSSRSGGHGDVNDVAGKVHCNSFKSCSHQSVKLEPIGESQVSDCEGNQIESDLDMSVSDCNQPVIRREEGLMPHGYQFINNICCMRCSEVPEQGGITCGCGASLSLQSKAATTSHLQRIILRKHDYITDLRLPVVKEELRHKLVVEQDGLLLVPDTTNSVPKFTDLPISCSNSNNCIAGDIICCSNSKIQLHQRHKCCPCNFEHDNQEDKLTKGLRSKQTLLPTCSCSSEAAAASVILSTPVVNSGAVLVNASLLDASSGSLERDQSKPSIIADSTIVAPIIEQPLYFSTIGSLKKQHLQKSFVSLEHAKQPQQQKPQQQQLASGETLPPQSKSSKGKPNNYINKRRRRTSNSCSSSSSHLSECQQLQDVNKLPSVDIKVTNKVLQQQEQDQEERKINDNNKSIEWKHMDWNGIAQRYGKMPRQHRSQFWWRLRQTCFCHLIFSTFQTLFPILSSFKSYSLPRDFLADLLAGFTIAVLHIPQGMAYGLLAGVEPIYGLYVSFVPVLIMALMSKSRHVSYGTFAIISMLLVNATDSVKQILKQQVDAANNNKNLNAPPAAGPIVGNIEAVSDSDSGGLVLTNNHQPAIVSPEQILRNLLITSPTNSINYEEDQQAQMRPTAGLSGENATWLLTSTSLWPATFDSQTGDSFVIPSNIEILTCICIIVGLIQILMALMRLGILSLMFSDQLVSSFTTASAVHVVSSQLGGLFDLNLAPVPEGLFRVCRIWWLFVATLVESFNYYTALLSLFSVLFLLTVKEIIEPMLRRRFKSLTCLPSELVLMSFLIFSSWYWQFNETFDIRIIGNVPTGLPAPQIPRLELAPLVIQDAITIALVSFAMNLSLAQVYAKRYKYTLDPNQELFALGTSNFVSSFFSCYPCASSLSRSAVQSNLNPRSQLCSLFSCAIVISIICYFAPILHDLPRSTLSCIIIVALKGILIQVKDLYENWRLSKLDAFVWMMTFTSVVAFGVTYGLVLGIVASLFMVFFRLLTPNHSILGQLPGTEIYVDTNAFIECNELEQVKIFRFNSALCYLNRTMFKSYVEKSLPSIYKQPGFSGLFCSNKKQSYSMESDHNKIKFLIIDCSALAYCDYSGAATLVEIIEELEEQKLIVYLAACPLKLINMIEKMQKNKVIEKNIYPSITDAISRTKYLRSRMTQTLSGSLSASSSICLQSMLGFVP